MTSRITSVAFAALMFGTACPEPTDLCPEVEALPGGPDSEEDPTALAIGDSIFATNSGTCQGIAGQLSLDLGLYVQDEAVSGRRLTRPEDEIDITRQYSSGDWDLVVLDGGGNDLIQECVCNGSGTEEACMAVVDELHDPTTGTGEMAALLDTIAADSGAQVVLLGYYLFASDSWANFDGCNDYLAELDDRYAELAASRDDVTFVDGRELVDWDVNPDAYTFDHIHPSVAGSELLAQAIADVLAPEAGGDSATW